MADKKISALTAATTPLAGTEVLPVVQSGSTVQVAVSDLTAGRTVTASGLVNGLGAVGTPSYTFSGDLNTGMWSPAADSVAVSVNGAESFRVTTTGFGIGVTPTYKFDVWNAGSLSGRLRNNSAGAGLFSQLLLETNNGFSGTSQGYMKATSLNGGNADITLSFGTSTGTGSAGIERMVIDQFGNITASTGNIVIGTAGKGIDFSANTGNILTQYKEGTWTTTVTNTSNFTGTPTLSNGKYTRIGRLIMIEGKFSGTVTIGSLNTYFQFTLPISRASSADSGAGTIMTGTNLKLGAIENAGADTTTAYVVIPSTSLQPAGADTFLFTYIYTA